jgi:hypothetical protein
MSGSRPGRAQGSETRAANPVLLDSVSTHTSDLYVALEDFRDDASAKTRTKVLTLFQDLRAAMDAAETCLESWTPADSDPLVAGNIYTRNDLRELFGIRDATLNNGVFHAKERREIWLFVTENKTADREQYVDKLTSNMLHWQGQRLGRTDSLVTNHKQSGNRLLLFYRTAKYQFDGAGFRYEGPFEYVSHSGSQPTSFILRRQTARLGARPAESCRRRLNSVDVGIDPARTIVIEVPIGQYRY